MPPSSGRIVRLCLSPSLPPAKSAHSVCYYAKLAFVRPLFFAFTAFIGAYFLFFRSPSFRSSSTNRFGEDYFAMSLPSAKGWHARAHMHPSSATFVPSRGKLVFAVLLNAPADPEGFTVALFRPDVAVDARGRILQVQPDDFAALADLAEQVNRLPETGSFMTAWRVAHDRTDQPIDRLFVPVPGGKEIKQTSVQGWHPEKKKLKTPVADYTELPAVLHKLLGDIKEARTDYQRGQEENKDLIDQIKALVQFE
ncbi:hypothetical protein BN946_scf185002.g38 [Trametes cinnabarina]|uniref:Uncharacterized protein n=1 Tax=Pycnoporus cinnabarinus TaxID=5643 RepID=A0A060SKB7_PYCCI|nr:hypothetical protein BN946_scf185002.g38 [Trametes cinnabarina]